MFLCLYQQWICFDTEDFFIYICPHFLVCVLFVYGFFMSETGYYMWLYWVMCIIRWMGLVFGLNWGLSWGLSWAVCSVVRNWIVVDYVDWGGWDVLGWVIVWLCDCVCCIVYWVIILFFYFVWLKNFSSLL